MSPDMVRSDATAAASFRALGTTATVVVAESHALSEARSAVEQVLADVDLACSRFRDDSELAAVNRAGGRPVEVGDLFLEALSVALHAARITDGIVDPTIGHTIRVLGYDRDFRSVEPVTGASVPLVAVVPGWRTIALDTTARTVQLARGVELDLGATAKAFAADRAAAAAQHATGAGVLVSLGGDIAVAGEAPEGGWLVGIADDHAGSTPVDTAVAISSGGLATSSTTVRRWKRAGHDLHHIIDPRSGRPADVVWRTVTVAAPTCVDANIATTASVVLGSAAPVRLADAGLPARLVASDGKVVTVGGWPE